MPKCAVSKEDRQASAEACLREWPVAAVGYLLGWGRVRVTEHIAGRMGWPVIRVEPLSEPGRPLYVFYGARADLKRD